MSKLLVDDMIELLKCPVLFRVPSLHVCPNVPTYHEGGLEKVSPWRVPIRFFREFQSPSELPAILSSSQLPFHMDSPCSAATLLPGLTFTGFTHSVCTGTSRIWNPEAEVVCWYFW